MDDILLFVTSNSVRRQSDPPRRAYGSAVDATSAERSTASAEELRLRSMVFQRVEEARTSMLESLRATGGTLQLCGGGSYLMHQGDPAVAGFVVEQGRVKVGRIQEDGSQVILKVAPPGDFIGLIETLVELPYARYAQATTSARVWRLDRQRILSMLDSDRRFARAMLVVTSVRFLESQLSIAGLHAGPIRARLVYLLMKLAHETAVGCRDGCVIDLELDQEEMASVIGTTRQSVSSLLTAMKHEGLIHATHRTLTIPTWGPVLAWASTHSPD